MTLTEFLAARLDEDEAAAVAAALLPGKDWDAVSQGPGRERDGVLWDEDHANITAWFDGHMNAAEHAARHDPARVLREIAAKRAILAEYMAVRRLQELTGGDHHRYREWVLRHLAAAWSDHPDYDPEWAPEPCG